MKLVIEIPNEVVDKESYVDYFGCFSRELYEIIKNGTPLPKSHGRLIDENYLLSILQCEEYETCTWRNCSDCNREKCIKRHEVLSAPTIIEADKESEDKE